MVEEEINTLIFRALEEDSATYDITSKTCISSPKTTVAHLRLKQDARVAGLIFMPRLFQAVDPTLAFTPLVEEGSLNPPGTLLARIEGNPLSLLAAERSALNLIQHLSGIATTVSHYVDAVKNYACDILDTRKTLPGLRHVQKYAVRIGGGKNHRFHLGEQILIKNNHLALLKQQGFASPIKEALARAASAIIEVESLAMMQEALEAGAKHIILDNMDVPLLEKAVVLGQGQAYLEASGGMTLSNVQRIAATGVNGISIGALTHSVCAVDIHLFFT